MAQPTLRTQRLTLVPLADEHLEHEVELDSRPEVMRYLTGRPRTRDEVDRFKSEHGVDATPAMVSRASEPSSRMPDRAALTAVLRV